MPYAFAILIRKIIASTEEATKNDVSFGTNEAGPC
jgi:hypothetical protein